MFHGTEIIQKATNVSYYDMIVNKQQQRGFVETFTDTQTATGHVHYIPTMPY